MFVPDIKCMHIYLLGTRKSLPHPQQFLHVEEASSLICSSLKREVMVVVVVSGMGLREEQQILPLPPPLLLQ